MTVTLITSEHAQENDKSFQSRCKLILYRKKKKQFHLLQPQFLLNKVFEFIGTTTRGFDDFCLCIDKMVFDEI